MAPSRFRNPAGYSRAGKLTLEDETIIEKKSTNQQEDLYLVQIIIKEKE